MGAAAGLLASSSLLSPSGFLLCLLAVVWLAGAVVLAVAVAASCCQLYGCGVLLPAVAVVLLVVTGCGGWGRFPACVRCCVAVLVAVSAVGVGCGASPCWWCCVVLLVVLVVLVTAGGGLCWCFGAGAGAAVGVVYGCPFVGLVTCFGGCAVGCRVLSACLLCFLCLYAVGLACVACAAAVAAGAAVVGCFAGWWGAASLVKVLPVLSAGWWLSAGLCWLVAVVPFLPAGSAGAGACCQCFPFLLVWFLLFSFQNWKMKTRL